VHHIIHWLFGGKTNMDNLVMLCVSCHHRIHYDEWRIEVKQGEVWFTPPEDIDPTRTPRKGGLADLELAA
jgi:5-methylcytosine-specific restriction endonuclease McrA